MKPALLATVLSTCIAGQAAALSCTPASVAVSFQEADRSEAQYLLAVGRVKLLPGQSLPQPSGDPNERQGYSVETQFTGQIAGPNGFEQDVTFPLTVEVQCAGPWCGGVPIDRVLAFIERRDDRNVLVDGPCPMFTLDATPEAVAQAEACLSGGPCEQQPE